MTEYVFRDHAPTYWAAGISVVPVVPGTKRPPIKNWSGYCNNLPSEKTRQHWQDRFGDYGIGVLLGKAIKEDFRLSAIDVDDNAYVRVTNTILGICPVAKFGKKGMTYFTLAPKTRMIKSTKFSDYDKAGIIDVLITSKMTVVPPTIHPETKKPYRWTGPPLAESSMDELPIFDERKFRLLKLVVGSEYTPTLLTGKTTHEAGLALSAQLVSFGCDAEEVTDIFKALLPEDYQGNSLAELPGWIEGALEKGFDAAGTLPFDDNIAQLVEGEFRPLGWVSGDGFVRYKDGHWQLLSENDIDRTAKSILTPFLGSKRQVRPVLDNVRFCLRLNVERKDFGESTGRVCLLNGTINMKTGELEAYSPDHELRYQLDINHDPGATCPTYEAQVLDTLGGDEKAVQLFDEFAALTLIPDLRFQKALYLMGPAGSGKSTLLRVIESMHDPKAISVTPLDKIGHERSITHLANKLICISYDVQTNRKIFGENFIRITGGDPVETRKLYSEVEVATPSVRFIGSMNPDMPGFIGAPDALKRRLIFLKCGERVEEPDPDRPEKLKAERSGILNRWTVALQRLLARGKFEIPVSSRQEVLEFIRAFDPFDEFTEEKLEKDSKTTVPVAEITREYNYWAEEHGERPLSSNVVGRKLKRLGFEAGFERRVGNNKSKNTRVVYTRVIDPMGAIIYREF